MLVESMKSALISMEDKHHSTANLREDFIESDTLLGFHSTWLDDDYLHNLPLTDVFTNVSTPFEETTDQSKSRNPELNEAPNDFDTPLLDAALDFTFDTELSPILEPFTDATAAMSPFKPQRQSKSPRTRKTTRSPLGKVDTSTGSRQVSSIEKNRTNENEVLSAEIKRPRTRGSSWLEEDQNTFFTMFKIKWPPTPKGQSTPSFPSLLLQRFNAISTKMRIKTVMEVRQFYTTVMHNVSDLLRVVQNDIDLTNPDQVRIAVWCWSKLMAEKTHLKEFESLGPEFSTKKTKLANLLLQSIIRSRRQMLKAKSDIKHTPAHGLTSISAWVARSNLSSFFSKPHASSQKVQIHYPLVRKKQKQVALIPATKSAVIENVQKVLPILQQLSCNLPARGALKRKRITVNTNSSKAKKTCYAEVDSVALTSPGPKNKRSWTRTQNGVAFSTPQQSRKKIYIKMRLIPRDKQTKADVVHCGYRPKVELKLSSTKKISEITDHMSKKWAKVNFVMPKGSVLCLYQKNGTKTWPMEDSYVTCHDIWKRCGKQSNSENVVEFFYVWQLPLKNYVSDQDQHLMPLRAPPGLFDGVSAVANEANSSSDERESFQLFPVCGLQEFGEQVAFDRSITEAAEKKAAALRTIITDIGDGDFGKEFSPTTGRLRRRIKPLLVLKEEFNI